MHLSNYTHLGGIQPETAAVKNILTFHGVVSPHDGQPFSEAMLLGIGGGLGACYILWEFEKHGEPSLVLAFRNLSNYPVRFLERLAARLGSRLEVFETAGRKKAASQLEKTLSAGDPAMLLFDLGGAPYYMHFLQVGTSVAYGLDEHHVTVDFLSEQPYHLPLDLAAEARGKVPSYKNRLLTLHPETEIDLEAAIVAGLGDCVDYLGTSSTSFALPSLRKWARMMTDPKNKKGWPTVFESQHGLYGTLRAVYVGINHAGTGGGGMRGFYAEFLREAALLLGWSDLNDIAAGYQDLHGQWQALAQAALPDTVPEFQETKAMLDRRAELHRKQGSAGLEALQSLNDDLHALKGELNPNFPLSAAQTTALFASLQDQIQAIYAAEKRVLAELKDTLSRHADTE
jgi:hypothetical protein